MNCLPRIPILLILLLALCSTAFAEVEAVRGKRYRLTKRHGPWMIMVADIRDVPPELRKEGGMTALQAADLVSALADEDAHIDEHSGLQPSFP